MYACVPTEKLYLVIITVIYFIINLHFVTYLILDFHMTLFVGFLLPMLPRGRCLGCVTYAMLIDNV
jgi:hypothetical protein